MKVLICLSCLSRSNDIASYSLAPVSLHSAPEELAIDMKMLRHIDSNSVMDNIYIYTEYSYYYHYYCHYHYHYCYYLWIYVFPLPNMFLNPHPLQLFTERVSPSRQQVASSLHQSLDIDVAWRIMQLPHRADRVEKNQLHHLHLNKSTAVNAFCYYVRRVFIQCSKLKVAMTDNSSMKLWLCKQSRACSFRACQSESMFFSNCTWHDEQFQVSAREPSPEVSCRCHTKRHQSPTTLQ